MREPYTSTQVAIVGGGGGVGASTAFNLLLRDEPYDVALIDRRPEMAVSHEMDLQQVVAQGASGSVRVGGLEDLAGAGIVVVTAAAPLTLNTSRMVYLDDNVRILREVTGALAAAPDWPGVLLVVTNPVDVLVTWAVGHTEIPRERVAGYTLNDSLRLRTALGEELGVAGHRVDAWMIGEHGDAAVALLERVRVDGVPISVGASQRAAALDWVRDWYARHVALDSGRSSTWTSGRGVARMVAALAHGDDEPWPASVVLEGEYGIDGVALSVPVTLGPGGVRAIHEWVLTAGEDAGLRRAAALVGAAAGELSAA
ncbi:malate dehydrogenase [Capillimicrobium parvum]|uniref:malate dehydrogenase n=1 Tax=Capillimicrobium parvum TaxID=2884022 RepID=UPI00216AC462|nr:hypothetical protein [Capillimicrobium parvum]